MPRRKPATGNGRARTGASDRGFSLVELMVVLLVISLALVITYPSLSRGTAALNLRAAGRDVLGTLRYARETAITEQKTMKVTFDAEKQQVILSDEVGDGARSYSMPRNVRMVRLLLSGREIVEPVAAIRYMTNGSSETAEIVLQSGTGATLTIVTDPITGGARILDSAAGAER